MDDRDVVGAITTGDPAGLAAAYDKYAAPLYGYCQWMLREPAAAADAVQAAFIIACAQLDALSEASQLRSWLYTVARNLARSEKRAEKVRHAAQAFQEPPSMHHNASKSSPRR